MATRCLYLYHQTNKYATLCYSKFKSSPKKVPKELETSCEQVEILSKTPVLDFKEIIKHSSTMRGKVEYLNVLDATQFNSKLTILPQWKFQWLNARTGEEDDKFINKRHCSKKRAFIINILG